MEGKKEIIKKETKDESTFSSDKLFLYSQKEIEEILKDDKQRDLIIQAFNKILTSKDLYINFYEKVNLMTVIVQTYPKDINKIKFGKLIDIVNYDNPKDLLVFDLIVFNKELTKDNQINMAKYLNSIIDTTACEKLQKDSKYKTFINKYKLREPPVLSDTDTL